MRTLLAVAALSLAGCVTPTVAVQPNSCSSLLPASWRDAVEGADLPDGNTVGDWIVFGEQQTGKLEVANSRTKDSIEIVSRCEERDKLAVQRATRRKVLGIF